MHAINIAKILLTTLFNGSFIKDKLLIKIIILKNPTAIIDLEACELLSNVNFAKISGKPNTHHIPSIAEIMSDIIKCPKCHENVEINIAHSVTEDGEVFKCPHCGWYFRYVER